jgi:DNA invertase Pin-like site-specific DNA recombinase
MRVAIYARVSTAQALGRQTVENQLMVLREFCIRKEWPIYREYLDDTSAVKNRPGYNQMLEDARSRKIDCIVAVRLDRIFRSTPEVFRVIGDLDRWRVRFLCSDQPIDTDRNDPVGRMILGFLAVIAEFERSLISERVAAGIARARKEGKKIGGRKPKQIDMTQAHDLMGRGLTITAASRVLKINRNLLAKALKNSGPAERIHAGPTVKGAD